MARENIPVIAIDGPVASGKGTVAACVANKLGWHLLESGVLYRALVVLAEHRGVLLDNDNLDQVAALAVDLDLTFQGQKNDLARVVLNGHDISTVVRSEMCGNLASKISQHSAVREALLEAQRKFKQAPGLVAEGRDMGTVVFKDAKYKFYIDATAENRAKRRYAQLKSRGITTLDFNNLLEEIKKRDYRDTTRMHSPLHSAADATIINTNNLNVLEVCDKILKLVSN